MNNTPDLVISIKEVSNGFLVQFEFDILNQKRVQVVCDTIEDIMGYTSDKVDLLFKEKDNG